MIEIVISENETGEGWIATAADSELGYGITIGPFKERSELEKLVERFFGLRTPATVIVDLGEDLHGNPQQKMAHLR